jgi:Condensation domain
MQLPLTHQQVWLWELLQRHGNWNCAVPYAFRVAGDLRLDILHSSLLELVRRHGALHTRIMVSGGIPAQVTGDPEAGRLVVTRVTGSCEAEIESGARQIFADFADRVTDPAVGPLLRVELLSLSNREHWLLLALHRLTADCFCAEQVVRELWHLYCDFSRGRPSPFPSDPPQYADYALWQQTTRREWLDRHEAYWNHRLKNATSVCWPTDRCSGLKPPRTLARMSAWFDDTVGVALQDLARRLRTLAASVMLAIYVAVVWKWCRQADFVVPFNIAGRQSEHKHVVGYFSHVLYLRFLLTGRETFSDLVTLVSGEFFRALSHQDFGMMASRFPQLMGGAFFQWITWHPEGKVPMPESNDARDLSVERLSLREFGAGLSALPPGMVDVDITFFDTPKGLYAGGVYRADLFRKATMERLMGDLRSSAAVLLGNPAVSLAAICSND